MGSHYHKFYFMFLVLLVAVSTPLMGSVTFAKSVDAYKVLGLSPSASEAEVKSAYRRLAKESHPDRGGDAEVFKKITNAYEAITKNKASTSQEPSPSDSGAYYGYRHQRGSFNDYYIASEKLMAELVKRLRENKDVSVKELTVWGYDYLKKISPLKDPATISIREFNNLMNIAADLWTRVAAEPLFYYTPENKGVVDIDLRVTEAAYRIGFLYINDARKMNPAAFEHYFATGYSYLNMVSFPGIDKDYQQVLYRTLAFADRLKSPVSCSDFLD